MTLKKASVFSVFVIVTCIGLVIFLPSSESPHEMIQSESSPEHRKVSEAQEKTVAQMPTDASSKSKLAPNSIVESNSRTLSSTDQFEFIFTPSAPALWPLNQHYNQVEIKRRNRFNALAIDIKRDLIENLSLGEKLNLYIPQTQRSLTITLSSIQQGKYSESRIAGVDGTKDRYTAYFTLGNTTLYGTIETPEGSFHIEKKETEDAVIYAASEIRKNLDYSVSDAVTVSTLKGNSQ